MANGFDSSLCLPCLGMTQHIQYSFVGVCGGTKRRNTKILPLQTFWLDLKYCSLTIIYGEDLVCSFSDSADWSNGLYSHRHTRTHRCQRRNEATMSSMPLECWLVTFHIHLLVFLFFLREARPFWRGVKARLCVTQAHCLQSAAFKWVTAHSLISDYQVLLDFFFFFCFSFSGTVAQWVLAPVKGKMTNW